MRIFLCAVVAGLLSGLTPVLAGTPAKDTYPDVASVPRVLLADLRRGEVYQDQYVSQLLALIRDNDARQSISKADIDERAKTLENSNRRQRYLELIHYDLDFDGSITPLEVGQIMLEDRRRQKQSEEGCVDEANRFVGRYDDDKDGVISLREMSLPSEKRKDPSARRMAALLALDPNHDGKLTVQELESLARKAFATLDADGDGTLTRDESSRARENDDDY